MAWKNLTTTLPPPWKLNISDERNILIYSNIAALYHLDKDNQNVRWTKGAVILGNILCNLTWNSVLGNDSKRALARASEVSIKTYFSIFQRYDMVASGRTHMTCAAIFGLLKKNDTCNNSGFYTGSPRNKGVLQLHSCYIRYYCISKMSRDV